jgi:hypothetical protein
LKSAGFVMVSQNEPLDSISFSREKTNKPLHADKSKQRTSDRPQNLS